MFRLAERDEVTIMLPRLLKELSKQALAMSDPRTTTPRRTPVNARVMATAFMLTVNPGLLLKQAEEEDNQDTAPLRLAATRFTALMEECVKLFDEHVMVPKRVTRYLLLDLLSAWSEYDTRFKVWKAIDLVATYRQLPVVLEQLRARYMQLPAGDPSEMPLLHDIMTIEDKKLILVQGHQWLLEVDLNNFNNETALLYAI